MDPDAVDEVGRVPHGGSDDPDPIDFSANTNPVRPEGVADVYEAALADATSYADDHPEFRDAAADYVGCDPADVVPTAGGVAALRLALGVTVSPGDRVALPEPGFGEYAREVRLQGGDPELVPHDELVDADPDPHALPRRTPRWWSARRTTLPDSSRAQRRSERSAQSAARPGRRCSPTRRFWTSPTPPAWPATPG